MRGHGMGAQTGIFLLFVVLLVAASCSLVCGRKDHTSDAVKNIGPEEFARLVGKAADSDGDMVLLDVRTKAEYDEAHIAGSILIPYPAQDFESRAAALDAGKTYLLYCRSGNRSSSAAGVLDKLGFENLYNLEGGLKAWIAEDMPVTKD